MTTMPALLITVTLTGLLMSMASAQTSTNPEPDAQLRALLATPGDPARGKKEFATCEGCHRKGQHASVVVKQVLDIRAGRRSNPSMQPFVVDPAFTMTHLVDIAAYLQALPFEGSIGKGPGTDLARGKELYERDCAACHGASGQGDAAKFYPMVSAQHYRYLLREVIAIRDGSRGNSNAEMVKVVKPYTPAEIEAVSDYMSQMAPPKS